MYILKKGRAGIQYNAGKTEALSLETMIRMSRMMGRMGRTSGTPFPRGLSSKIAIFLGSERSKGAFTAFSLHWMSKCNKMTPWLQFPDWEQYLLISFALRLLPGNGAPFIFHRSHAESRIDFSDKKQDFVGALHRSKITSVWSNVASVARKRTSRFRIMRIWCCLYFFSHNGHDGGNMEFKIRLSVSV